LPLTAFDCNAAAFISICTDIGQGLVKTALEITQEISVNQPAENCDYVGVDKVEDLTPETEEDSPAITPPKKERTQKSRTANRRLGYRLIKELWAFHEARIAVRFAYEWHEPIPLR
jgi:hypothetical protein